jgi:hypothetical protein
MGRILILIVVVALTCQPAFSQSKKKGNEKRQLVRVLNMDRQLSVDSGCFVYALPRTVFRLSVVVERDVYTAGPYAAYAEKYLGIPKVQTTNKTRYTIKHCKIETYGESDTRHLYVVQPSDNSMRFDFFKMTKDGLLLLADNFSQVARSGSRSMETQVAMPMFTNVGVESMFREVKRHVATAPDTADVEDEQMPVVPIAALQSKSGEERAAEAAQHLLTLRKRKFEMLTGDVEAVFNSNDALKVALAELKQLEREYLALFVGRHVKEQSTYYYEAAPTEVIDSYPLFKFSEADGIQNLDGQGRVFTLDLQMEDKYASAKISPTPKDDGAFKVRLPNVAQVRLLDGKDEIYKGRFWVYQHGKIVNVRFEQFLKTE